ncbi:MAG: S41 family peptidase [Patescibacteria group bacterium]
MKNIKEKKIKNILLTISVVVLVAGGFMSGIKYEDTRNDLGNIVNKETGKPEMVDFDIFWKSWKILDEKFVGDEKTETQAKVWGAIQGLANSLKDPYTIFLPPSEAAIFEDDIQGNFEGVGMEIGIRDNILTVIAPLKGTPAERAGIQPQDKILEIDGVSTFKMDTSEAVQLIRGEKGTEVVFLVSRKNTPENFKISVVRDTIDIPTINTEKKEDVFIIHLYSFTAVSPNLFRDALREFIDSNTNKLIVDLRGNPGGYLEAANDIASWFLPMGKIVVTEDYGGNQTNKIHQSKGYDIFNDSLKMVILVNGGSASASEILAGALSEYGKATLVGTKTFGKGSVQELVKITPETSLKVTVARWLTPNGNSISQNGLEPDVEIDITEEDTEYLKEGGDPQIDKAMEVLNEM